MRDAYCCGAAGVAGDVVEESAGLDGCVLSLDWDSDSDLDFLDLDFLG